MPALMTLGVAVLGALGEWMHARRSRRIARLAFDGAPRPRLWARAAPVLRVLGLASAVFGASVLMTFDPRATEESPSARVSKQVLIALDVSPSMHVEDAGPNSEKVSRMRWAGTLVQGILDRLNMKETRITLVAFYTKAIPVLEDTTDKNIISNMFDGLRMYVAFEPGPTDLHAGVEAAVEIAKPWARRSTTLVIISDGDANTALGSVRLPPAIADTIVIGVGDPRRPTVVGGHGSKQESSALKALAAHLGGYYHEGNRLQLPSSVLRTLTMVSPARGAPMGLRDVALVCVALGCSVTAFIGPALMIAGTRSAWPRRRADAQRGARIRSSPPVGAGGGA